jgi:glycosyltransferase involved in cell wall biosynthesis
MADRRILFAAHASYLDDSNGASVASRAMMEALSRQGFAAEAISGTFLGHGLEVRIADWLAGRGLDFEACGGGALSVGASGLWAQSPIHYRLIMRGVMVTLHECTSGRPHLPDKMERSGFLRLFGAILDRFHPDVLVNFGGDLLAEQIRAAARAAGATVVFALHNFSYPTIEPFKTVDAVMVPSRFSAEHYRRTLGLECTVLPNLIDFDRVRANTHVPRYVTFITPSYEKGVYAFARVADELGRLRHDIPLLVVEGRGTERTLADCGIDLRVHGNVSLMGNTPDPRHFWGVTKICLMPSLWMESQGLVAAEAMINGIPVIASDRGALPETLGDAGILLPLPERLTPTSRILPTAEEVAPWVEAVIRLWDDESFYAEQSRLALSESRRWRPEVLESQYVQFFENVRRKPGDGA